MPRALWKGAITFGLVHIPVALYPAARENRLDFDWLDRNDMKPVGYRRVNKVTGKEVAKEDIVKGMQVEDGHYVVLTDEEIKAARPDKTQTVDILAFVDASEISPQYFDSPYVLAPTARGEKVYLLLREALKKTGRIGIAQVVIQTKQHLAALIPQGDALMLNTMRWSDEIRSTEDMGVPGEASGKLAPTPRELQMAEQLIEDMSAHWDPAQYQDHTRDEIMALVHEKMDKGEISRVEPVNAPAEGGGAEIYDLTELLKRSLKGGGGGGGGAAKPARDDEAANDEAQAPAPAPRRAAASRRTADRSSTPASKPASQRAAAKDDDAKAHRGKAAESKPAKAAESRAGKAPARKRA
jgi:DNA end-binding protein Ku